MKLQLTKVVLTDLPGSPVSDDGRGLKLVIDEVQDVWRPVRPSAMTGVD